MKKILTFILAIALPVFCFAQGTVTKVTQGSAGQAIYQLSYYKFVSGFQLPVLSSAPVKKGVTGQDSFTISQYIDSASNQIMTLQPNGKYLPGLLASTLTNQTLKKYGYNVIYTSPNIFNSHQGVCYDNNKLAYCIATAAINKRNSNSATWPVLATNNSPFTGLPATINHLGGATVYNGRLYIPVERYVACGNSSLTHVAWYDTSTLALINYHKLDSITEVSGICFTPNGHLWATNFCDSLNLYEYNNDTAFTFLGKRALSIPIGSMQGICYNSGSNVFYISSNNGKIIQVASNGMTVDSVLFSANRFSNDGFENIDYNDGVIKWMRTDENNLGDFCYFLSATKTPKDYAYLYNTGGYQSYGTFNISADSGSVNKPTLYLESQGGRASLVMNSVTGNPVDIGFRVGGKRTFDISSRGGDENGDLIFYAYNNAGDGIQTNKALWIRRDFRAVGINAATKPVFALEVGGTTLATGFRISALQTAPASATATGTTGEIRFTNGFIYLCVATNTWIRAALSTW